MFELLSIIESIERGRREANKEPICAPFVEIWNECTQEQRKTVKSDLNELCKSGKTMFWKSINDTIFKIV